MVFLLAPFRNLKSWGWGAFFSGVRITHTHTHTHTRSPTQTHIYTQAKAITRLNKYIFTWTQTQRLFLSVKHTHHTHNLLLSPRAHLHTFFLSSFFLSTHSRTHKQTQHTHTHSRTHTVHVPARAALLWDAGIINAEWLIALETDQSRERHCPDQWSVSDWHFPSIFQPHSNYRNGCVCHQRIGQGCAETQLLSGLSCTPSFR